MRTIVIGLGNPVRSDDAVGLIVAQKLREVLCGRGIADVEELWAGGLRLAEAMTGYDRAIVIDAMTTNRYPPGHVGLVDMEELGDCNTVTCVHDASLSQALALWRQAGEPMPNDIRVFGVEAQDVLTLSESLTPPVALAVPVAVERVLQILGALKECG